MAIEIERKFLLRNADWRAKADNGTVIKQGYLNTDKTRTVRVRLKGTKAYLTVKGETVGKSRAEFEYEIPVVDAEAMLKLCEQPIIEKTRYLLVDDNLTWEIDIFDGDNKGLEMAEVELENENQEVPIPDWVGDEVTYDKRYFNSYLVNHPYRSW